MYTLLNPVVLLSVHTVKPSCIIVCTHWLIKLCHCVYTNTVLPGCMYALLNPVVSLYVHKSLPNYLIVCTHLLSQLSHCTKWLTQLSRVYTHLLFQLFRCLYTLPYQIVYCVRTQVNPIVSLCVHTLANQFVPLCVHIG